MRCNSSSDKFIISSITALMALLPPLAMAFVTDEVRADEAVPIGSAPLAIAQLLHRAVSASREEKTFGGAGGGGGGGDGIGKIADASEGPGVRPVGGVSSIQRMLNLSGAAKIAS